MKNALQTSSTLNLQQTKQYLDSLDLTQVIQRVMKEKRWSKRMAETAALFYKNFLYLCKKYQNHHLVPTQQIDEIWHAHILYTKDYHTLSHTIFGQYLHHHPLHKGQDIGASDHHDPMNLLQTLHSQEFGYKIYDTVYSPKDILLFIRQKLFRI